MKLDWTKLTDFKHYKLFFPTKEKVAKLALELKDGYLNLSDEYRNEYNITNLLLAYFSSPSHLFYEIGKFGGILGFTYIIEGHKCQLSMKLWDKNVFTHNSVKEAKRLIKTIMDEFKLIKINTETADIRVKQMAEMLGFEEDGIRKRDFSFDSKKYDLFLLSMGG